MISLILRTECSIPPRCEAIKYLKQLVRPYVQIMRDFEDVAALYVWLKSICPHYCGIINEIQAFKLEPWIRRPRKLLVHQEIQKFLGYITLHICQKLETSKPTVADIQTVIHQSIFLNKLFGLKTPG